MGELRNEEFVRSFLGVRGNAPGANAIVDAGGVDARAIGRQGEGVEFFGRFLERVETLATGDAPELYGAIAADTGEEFATDLNSRPKTGPLWPVSVATGAGLPSSQSKIV